jgi:hypothetical protein
VPHHEEVLEEWKYRDTILDVSTGWRWVVNFAPQPLYSQRKKSLYPYDRSLCWPLSWSGCSGKEKKSQLLPEIEP